MGRYDTKYPTSLAHELSKLEKFQCFNCVKKFWNQRNLRFICLVRKNMYFKDCETSCEYCSTDIYEWYNTLQQLIDGYPTQIDTYTKKAIQQIEEEIDEEKYEDWKEVYYSEVHKPLSKPGGGEKNDRTHKIFGKERMKDNRYIEPWGSQNRIKLPKK